MNSATVDKYETRVPDAEGWHGIPFRVPYGGMRAGTAGNSNGPCRVARGRVLSGPIRLRKTARS